MNNYRIEEQTNIYKLLLSAMYSDNTDYINDKLNEIYTIIYNHNIKEEK